MKVLHRERLKQKEYVPPFADLRVHTGDKTLVMANTGSKTWVFNEVVIAETELEDRQSLAVFLMEEK